MFGRTLMPEAHMTALLADHHVIERLKRPDQAIYRNAPSAASCRFNRDQLVLYVVELHQSGVFGALFEVERSRLEHVATKFFPGVTFGENRITGRACAKPALFRIADFK